MVKKMKSKNIIKAIAIGSLLAMGTTMLPNLNFNVESADAAIDSSTGKITWEKKIKPDFDSRILQKLNNMFVGVNPDAHTIVYSNDGLNYTYVNYNTDLDTDENKIDLCFNALVYNNGYYYDMSYDKKKFFKSSDLKNWTSVDFNLSNFEAIKNPYDSDTGDIFDFFSTGNKIFVVIQNYGILFSDDNGVTWNNITNNSGIDNLFYSFDGKTKQSYYKIIYFKNKYFAYNGYPASDGGGYYQSDDCLQWTKVDTNYPPLENAIVCNDTMYALCNIDGIYYTKDGVNWARTTTPSKNQMGFKFVPDDIIYANGLFISRDRNKDDYYAYSTDGKDFSQYRRLSNCSEGKLFELSNKFFYAGLDSGYNRVIYCSGGIPTLKISSTDSTNSNLQITYEADNTDYISVKLPSGEISNTVSGEYEISKNGTYDFVFTKSDGTEETKSIEVTNIDKVAPTMTIEKTKSSDGTKYSVRVNSPDTDISSIRLADGTQVNNPNMPYNFNITKNGSYRITLKDKAGNVTSERISITDLVTTTSNKSEAQEKIDKITDKSYISDISDAIDSVSRLPEGSDKDSAIRDLLDKIKSYLKNSSNEDKLDSVSALIDRTQNNQVTNIDNNLSIPRKSTISAIKTISNKEEKKAMIDELAKSTNDLSGTFIDGGNKLQLSASNTSLNIGDNLNLSSITQLNYNGVDLSPEQINSLELVPEDSSFFEGTKAIKEGTTKVRVKLSSEESVSPMKARTRFLRASSLKLMAAANDISTFEETVNPAISEPIDIKIIQPASLSADTTTPSKTVDITCNGSSDVYPSVTCPDGSSINVGQSYTVSENGTYSFEFLKSDGNTETKTITISNIDKDKPTLTVNSNTEEETKDNVILSVSADDENFDYIELPNGEKVTEKTATYEVSENGSYTFKAVDKVGNETIKEVNVTNINKITPPAPIPSEGNTSISTEGKTDNGVNVTFNQKDSIQLTLSTNKIDFGDVTGLTHSDSHNPEDLVANVKSSLSYDLDVKANDNFKKSDENDLSVPISKLGVKVDANDYTKFTEVNTPINLVSNAPATYTVGDDGQNYTLKFDLDSTIGYKAGTYEAPLTITATQK